MNVETLLIQIRAPSFGSFSSFIFPFCANAKQTHILGEGIGVEKERETHTHRQKVSPVHFDNCISYFLNTTLK